MNILKNESLLSTRNEVINDINKDVLQMFPGVSQTFLSADATVLKVGADNHNIYPMEYLNSLELLGLSPSKLQLKIGCPIILLRNITPKHDLCNGSRLIVTHISSMSLKTGF